jgi:hypothetical protein
MLEHWVVEVQSEAPEDRPHHSIGIRIDKSGQRQSQSVDSGSEVIETSCSVPMHKQGVPGVAGSEENVDRDIVAPGGTATLLSSMSPAHFSSEQHMTSSWSQGIPSSSSRSKFRAAHMHYAPEGRSREVGDSFLCFDATLLSVSVPCCVMGRVQVSVIIRRRVQPGKEAEFERALTEMYDFCAGNVQGSVGASFVRPPKGSKSNEYTVGALMCGIILRAV